MPNHRPNEPIAPATIPGQPLDPKIPPDQSADSEDAERHEDDDVGTDERGNEMLSANLQQVTAQSRSASAEPAPGMSAETSKGERRIPDRSAEPAVQESLDAEKATTAASSNDASSDAPHEARDDEGNAVEVTADPGEAPRAPRPDADAGSQ